MIARGDAARFLGRSMVVRVATLSQRGEPHITPLWFVVDGRKFYMAPRAASPAARHVSASPNVVMLFDGERRSRRRGVRVLRIGGRARLVRRLPLPVLWRFALKYHLSSGGLRNLVQNLRTLPVRVRYYGERAGEGGVLEVSPETVEFLEVPAATASAPRT